MIRRCHGGQIQKAQNRALKDFVFEHFHARVGRDVLFLELWRCCCYDMLAFSKYVQEFGIKLISARILPTHQCTTWGQQTTLNFSKTCTELRSKLLLWLSLGHKNKERIKQKLQVEICSIGWRCGRMGKPFPGRPFFVLLK